MDVKSKALLMTNASKYYTLTVSLNPASATCTLTYDGSSHNETSATVKEGTIISYSIYHATYGTTTGSITMDNDKTLTCTGTYDTTYTYQLDINETGSLTRSGSHNEIVSGFSSSNYCYSTYLINWSNVNTLEMQVKATTNNSSANVQRAITGGVQTSYDNFWIFTQAGIMYGYLSGSGSRTTLPSVSNNTTYTIKCAYSNNTWAWYVNGTYHSTASYNKSNMVNDYLALGFETSNNAKGKFWDGTIDLSGCYIKVNGSIVWQGLKSVPHYTYYWNKTVS